MTVDQKITPQDVLYVDQLLEGPDLTDERMAVIAARVVEDMSAEMAENQVAAGSHPGDEWLLRAVLAGPFLQLVRDVLDRQRHMQSVGLRRLALHAVRDDGEK